MPLNATFGSIVHAGIYRWQIPPVNATGQPCNRAHKFIRKKIASCINLHLPIVIFKNRLLGTCIIVKRTCISIFTKIGL